MKKLQFKTQIDASSNHVYNTMLAEDTYKQWTAEFNPTSSYEGSWDKGSTILFVGLNKEGKKEGMVAKIKENVPGSYVSIEHIGLLDGDEHVTEGPAVEGWAGAKENYTFSEESGATTLTVDVDTNEEYITYFNDTWPKALNKLKTICES
ncbi:MAG TPA: SRPBCC domain-containing protein [Pedobacter sp.]|jgi:uncharacterized protein YndB with AHSA1/START domain